jgi:hypothetical protein
MQATAHDCPEQKVIWEIPAKPDCVMEFYRPANETPADAAPRLAVEAPPAAGRELRR